MKWPFLSPFVAVFITLVPQTALYAHAHGTGEVHVEGEPVLVKRESPVNPVVVGGIAVVGIGAGGFIFWMKRKSALSNKKVAPPAAPTQKPQ